MTRAVNVSDNERIVSSLLGAAIAGAGLRERSVRGVLMIAGGAALMARGASGYCPAYAALNASVDADDTKDALGGRSGIHVEEAVTVNCDVNELYRVWRELETLPHYIGSLTSVTRIDDRRSRWVVTGPGGKMAHWDAEIINDIPNHLIAWKTVGDSDVVSAGSVRFTPVKGRHETSVHVKLQYDPPGGHVGGLIAWLMGREPGRLIREGLRRFKALTETGEAPTTEGQPRGQQSILNYD